MQTHATLLRRSRNEVPRLEAILDLCRGRVGLDIEIKEPGYEAEVVEAASSRFPRDRLLYTSFDESVIATVKRLDPNGRCGLLLGPGRLRSRAQRYEALPFDLAERCGADLLAVHQLLAPLRTRSAGRKSAGTGLVAEAHLRKFPLMVWTVDGPQRLHAYLSDGRVTGIITDLPGLAVETRRDIATYGGQEDSMPAHVTGLSRPALTDRVRPVIPR